MSNPSRFTLNYRSADLVARLFLTTTTPNTRTDTEGETERRTLAELIDHGIVRALHNRQGRITEHRATRLGWAWWQGQTLYPVPRQDEHGEWEWIPARVEHHHVDPDTGRPSFLPDPDVDLVEVSTATDDDDDALIAAELRRLEQQHRPHGTCENCGEPNKATLGDGTPWCGECDGTVTPE